MKPALKLKSLFLERIQKLLDEKELEKYLKSLETEPPTSIRCNTLKISPEKLKERLTKKGWKISQPFKNYPEIMIVDGKLVKDNINEKNLIKNLDNKKRGDNLEGGEVDGGITNQLINLNKIGGGKLRGWGEAIIDLEPGELGRTLEHLLGYYYVQEIASMLPILVLEPEKQEKILDLAAAPGSKTTQIASELANTGLIIANDVSLGRIKILASNLEKSGAMNTIITRGNGIILCKKMEESNLKEVDGQGTLVPYLFDKILVDAPCSGEGTLRSSPKTAQMWNINSVKSLSGLQKKLVANTIPLLKKNGILVYSTCTHAPEENEEVVDFVLKNFKDVKIEEIELPVKTRKGITRWNNKKYSEAVKLSCRIYPQDNNTDGFFIAKFRRVK